MLICIDMYDYITINHCQEKSKWSNSCPKVQWRETVEVNSLKIKDVCSFQQNIKYNRAYNSGSLKGLLSRTEAAQDIVV